MHLVEIVLPLNDNNGRPFAAEKYAAVRQHLTERFRGLSAASATGHGELHRGTFRALARWDDGNNDRTIVHRRGSFADLAKVLVMLRDIHRIVKCKIYHRGFVGIHLQNNAMRLDEQSGHAQRRSLVVLWLPAADHRR